MSPTEKKLSQIRALQSELMTSLFTEFHHINSISLEWNYNFKEVFLGKVNEIRFPLPYDEMRTLSGIKDCELKSDEVKAWLVELNLTSNDLSLIIRTIIQTLNETRPDKFLRTDYLK